MNITFDVDTNNLLTVTAMSLHDKKRSKIEIKNDLRANQEAIEKMIQNVGQREHEEERRRKDNAAQMNLTSILCKITERLQRMNDTFEPMSLQKQDAIDACQKELNRVFEWMEKNDGGFSEAKEYEYHANLLKKTSTPILGSIFNEDD